MVDDDDDDDNDAADDRKGFMIRMMKMMGNV